MKPAVRVEGIGKKYHIGALKNRERQTLGDMIVDTVVAPVRRAGKLLRGQATGAAELDEVMWALQDISFDVLPGETVGIIGHNGAGKSTLLKILSRITEPTTGFAEIRGRVGSLLEVGTGFHPELTGRENVYLNGTILGMGRAEIDAKFDEIVAFSEIEKFIDTPVKHYSTGMSLRLAFAVAAHLEPEVLIVDEVLAVGDAAFQRKCFGKMDEVADQGRTVIMVSHNMSAIIQLCERALLLSGGRIIASGAPGEVVDSYLMAGDADNSSWSLPDEERDEREKSRDVVLESVRVLANDGSSASFIPFEESFQIEVTSRVLRTVKGFGIRLGLHGSMRELLWVSWDTDDTGWATRERTPGTYVSTCTVPGRLLRPGHYTLDVNANIPRERQIDVRNAIIGFDVTAVGFPFSVKRKGLTAPLLDWHVDQAGSER